MDRNASVESDWTAEGGSFGEEEGRVYEANRDTIGKEPTVVAVVVVVVPGAATAETGECG